MFRGFVLAVILGLAKGQSAVDEYIFQEYTRMVWEADVNRLCDRDLLYDANPGAGGQIFTFVNESAFNSLPSFVEFESFFSRYNPVEGSADACNCEADERAFLRTLMATEPMRMAQNYIANFSGGIYADDANFEEYLYNKWFRPYSRSGGVLDSSGFQHVFLGEREGGSVGGMHNWLRMYREEQAGNFVFSSQIREPCGTDIPSFRHDWSGSYKNINSMWMRTSPEVEFALYTMAFETYGGQVAPLKLDNFDVNVQTYRWQDTNSIAAAYTLCS